MKLAKFFHIIRVTFSKAFILIAIVLLGSAILSIYSFINFINKIALVFKINPSFFISLFIILITIPLISYFLEKRLNSYFKEK
ncbi:hypothetical protein SAMN05428976_104157 [Clostridium sp. USBA 49]|uniref:hypothetical protein n=1 Tax=Clostridium TaxID=1485 RepID=UPI000999BC05|nr:MULTISPECIES: hypothetical protein [Clostridium]SKA81129.1 hypothetical protein SAMN05428976_104157 [Clostridium sp. USBA 49]